MSPAAPPSDVRDGAERVRPAPVRGRDREQDAREPRPLQPDAHLALLRHHLLHNILQQAGNESPVALQG